MSGSKESAKIQELRNYLRQLPGGKHYVLIGNFPYSNGTHLFRKPQNGKAALLIAQTLKNYDMLQILTDPNFDLQNLSKDGFFTLEETSSEFITIKTLAQAARDHGMEFLELSKLLVTIPDRTLKQVESLINSVAGRMKEQ